MNKKRAIIIGAGPAGLTAAYELLTGTEDIIPIILEATNNVGGISQTASYKGNRIDMGGHRFFSKSEKVMNWWFNILPMQTSVSSKNQEIFITYQNKSSKVTTQDTLVDPNIHDEVMLVRSRLSRIFHQGKFFDYPLALNLKTISNLGFMTTFKIGISYIYSQIFKIRPESNLEHFFINRFGRVLYRKFFRDYTEKVWGVPCTNISAEWGAQRVKGLSLYKALADALTKIFPKAFRANKRHTETSLIEQFLYPKYGPGQMWQVVSDEICDMGGELHMESEVTKIELDGPLATKITYYDHVNQSYKEEIADFVISTMPVKNLVHSFKPTPPRKVVEVADGLQYRDFITVGILMRELSTPGGTIPDNWVYIQEPDITMGRLQIFNNWSEYMVAKPHETVWIGCEYFANENDELYLKDDNAIIELAKSELTKMGMIDPQQYIDGVVFRLPKAYPAYFGTYNEFETIKSYCDTINNLFLVGRNGMHKYNNQDHSMLTAMTAVNLIKSGSTDKEAIWTVNTESEYHETK